MGQLLRINFENKDYSFKLLSGLPADRVVNQLDVLVSGEVRVLLRNGSNWAFQNNNDAELNRLANAIGKALSLRFRI